MKTAKQLGISEGKYSSLHNLLGRMERGEIPADRFTMHTVGEPDCGTAGCILGWARGHVKNPVWSAGLTRHLGDGLWRLFMPEHAPYAYDAGLEQAECALRQYLMTGDPCWEDIYREDMP